MTNINRIAAILTLTGLTAAACAQPSTPYVAPPTVPPVELPTQQPTQQTAPQPAAVGQPVKDGKLTFTVKKVENGPAEIPHQFGNLKPLGKFVYVHVAVGNHAAEAQQFVASAQKLLAGSVEYSAEDRAALYLQDRVAAFQQLNPGAGIETLIVYDIPVNIRPTGIRFHDSLFSGGATVTF